MVSSISKLAGLPYLLIISVVLMSRIFGGSAFFVAQPVEMMMRKEQSRLTMSTTTSSSDNHIQSDSNNAGDSKVSIWENIAMGIFSDDFSNDIERTKAYTNTVSLLRVGIPSFAFAASAKIAYPYISIELANAINDSGVLAVVSQDASQYIQNILTTSGLTFSLLVGQTYYFMYQQQEAIYLALFEEVTMAKSLLEQVALVSQGREVLYERILMCVQSYIRDDLTKFNDIEPSILISRRPCDDPLEQILYLTSVGEPSLVYQTVRSLRQARSHRLGALQRKLPQLHMILLWTLAAIVLFTFPLLGAGSQTIGGLGILQVQSWYLGIIVFAISLTMGVVEELRRPAEVGAYNARTVLNIMVKGLEEELELRLNGSILLDSRSSNDLSMDPSVDSDGYLGPEWESFRDNI
mmetsp:Transcript_30638/g.35151  ORF Transcript_30638/g.35151 Transcript_30638/m.35151 type:complete len:408 (-) Transcript_30638:548-1771(-)